MRKVELMVRVPESLRLEVEHAAKEARRSLSDTVHEVLIAWAAQRKRKARAKQPSQSAA